MTFTVPCSPFSVRVQVRFEGSKVRGFEGSKVRRFEGSKVRGFEVGVRRSRDRRTANPEPRTVNPERRRPNPELNAEHELRSENFEA
jgi:hypothetical protein